MCDGSIGVQTAAACVHVTVLLLPPPLLLLLLLLLLLPPRSFTLNTTLSGASELLFWNLDNPSRPRLQSNGASASAWASHTVLLGWDVIGKP